MAGGGYIPDFGWSDPDGSSIIDWGYLESATTIPGTTVPATTEAPVTGPSGGIDGDRVAAGMVYRGGMVVCRARQDFVNGHRGTATLQPTECLIEIIDETGGVVSVVGRHDPVDPAMVRFLMPLDLAAPHNYLARITLKTLLGTTIGPRTFPLPVS